MALALVLAGEAMTDKAAVIAEIVELTAKPVIGPGDVTAHELADAMGIDPASVLRVMGRLVQAGQYATALKQHPITHHEHRVFWKVEGA